MAAVGELIHSLLIAAVLACLPASPAKSADLRTDVRSFERSKPMSQLDRERPRVRALLRITGDNQVVEAAPHPSATSIGALEGIGFGWPGNAASVSVYAFENYSAANDAMKALRAGVESTLAESDRPIVRSTVNGSLLLWATAPASDLAAIEKIAPLASHFAGEE